MQSSIKFSFSDEPVRKFCYDLHNERIEIRFDAYYDLLNDVRVKSPCTLVIKEWSQARSKLSSATDFMTLDQNIGVIEMILSLQIFENLLLLTVNTIDNRYVDFEFENAEVSLETQ